MNQILVQFLGRCADADHRSARADVDLRRGNITIELFQLPDAAPLPESRKNPSEDFRTHGVKHFGFEVKTCPPSSPSRKPKA